MTVHDISTIVIAAISMWGATMAALFHLSFRLGGLVNEFKTKLKVIDVHDAKITQIENVVIHRYGSMFPRLKQNELNGKGHGQT